MEFNFKKKILGNGMTILFEKRKLPLVSVAFAVRNGGINESLSEKGISHFIEHMLYKGTPTRDTQKIAEEISLLIKDDAKLGEIAKIINDSSDYIKSVELIDLYKDIQEKTGKVSATFKVLYEDTEKKLTREEIDKLRNKAINELQKVGAKLR